MIRIPSYLYVVGSPLFHFAIMIERVLATVYVKIYENQGKKIAIISTIIMWSLLAIFLLFIYLTNSMDAETFGHPMVYITITSIYNAGFSLILHYFLLFLVLCISFADYFLFRLNKKIKSNFFSSVTSYSLSQSYQAKQNILVMKIIFPLDFSYTFVFVLYNILNNFFRHKREEYGNLTFIRSIDTALLLLFIHAIITLFVYDYFLKKQNEIKKNFVKINMNMSSEIYFKSLNFQWK
ncbi:hypothetical protein ACQ4LE_004239 [Meloidogyne hapla]